MMDPFCALLAALNAVEAWLCWRDYKSSKTDKAMWALLSWVGSTAFWIVRGVVPR